MNHIIITQSSCTEDVFVHQATNICINIFVCRPRIYLYMEREIFVHNAFPAGRSLVCCCLLSYCLQRFVPSPSDGGVDNALLVLICFVGNLICFVGNQICPVGNRSGFVQRHLIRSKSGLVQLSWCLWCHFGAIIMVPLWCKSDKTLLLPVVLLWCNSPGAIRMVLVPLVRCYSGATILVPGAFLPGAVSLVSLSSSPMSSLLM